MGEEIDPFIGIDHFVMRVPVFPPHPHAGFSALTYLFEDSEGSFTNRDSLGNSLLIRPGELHWTTAGRGIIHEEIPEVAGQRDHGLQIFVNLAAAHKQMPPSVHHVGKQQMPRVERSGVRARIVVGSSNGETSPLTPPTPITLLDVHLEPGARFAHRLPPKESAFVYVLRGAVTLGPTADPIAVRAAHVASLAHDGDSVDLVGASPDGAWLVVFAGAPLEERVFAYGPFVMSSEADLARAADDYRSGRMGHLAPTRSDAWLNQPRR